MCNGHEGDDNRIRVLLAIFENNQPNGLRMMIQKFEYLNGDYEIRPWFKNTISKKMLRAWEEFNYPTNNN